MVVAVGVVRRREACLQLESQFDEFDADLIQWVWFLSFSLALSAGMVFISFLFLFLMEFMFY